MAALPTAPIDLPAALVILWLGYGKFYSLFSLLFGIGFALQLESAARDGDQRLRRFRRRLLVLLAIGLVHLTFIWEGDILALYALVGFALIPLRRLSQRAPDRHGRRHAAGAAGGGAGPDRRQPWRARSGRAAAGDGHAVAGRDGVWRQRRALSRAEVREPGRCPAVSAQRLLVPLRRPAHDGAPLQGAGDVPDRPVGGPKRHVARSRALGAAAATRAPAGLCRWPAGGPGAGADGGPARSAGLALEVAGIGGVRAGRRAAGAGLRVAPRVAVATPGVARPADRGPFPPAAWR